MASSKMVREPSEPRGFVSNEIDDDLYNFGEPKEVSIELCPGKFFSLREPTISELSDIEKLGSKPNMTQSDVLAQTICILHLPDPGVRKITLKEAKRLTAGHLKLLNDPISDLLGMEKKKKGQGLVDLDLEVDSDSPTSEE